MKKISLICLSACMTVAISAQAAQQSASAMKKSNKAAASAKAKKSVASKLPAKAAVASPAASATSVQVVNKDAAPASSMTTSTLTAAPATTGTSTAEMPKATKKISGSVLFLAERGFMDPKETQNTELDTQTHLKVGYKFANGNKLGINQRVFWSYMQNQEKQYLGNADLGTLRVELTTPVSIGAGSAIVYRLALPITQAHLDGNFLAGPAIIPALNWSVAPKTTISYNGYIGAAIYSGNRKVIPNSWLDKSADKVKGYDAASIVGRMSATGPQRGTLYIINGVGVSYELNKLLSLGTSLGYSLGYMDFSEDGRNLRERTSSYDFGVSADVNVASNVALSFGASQSIADNTRGVFDMVNMKAYPYFEEVWLFRDEQTTYSLSANVTF